MPLEELFVQVKKIESKKMTQRDHVGIRDND